MNFVLNGFRLVKISQSTLNHLHCYSFKGLSPSWFFVTICLPFLAVAIFIRGWVFCLGTSIDADS